MHNERNFNISFTEMKEILLEFSLSENFTKCFSCFFYISDIWLCIVSLFGIYA